LAVPRDGSPLGKGHYQANPDAVLQFLPAGTTLFVDDVQLDAAQVQAIFAGSSDVQAGTVLLLNLVQQLIAADFNVLRGVQPSAAVQQAIADANAALDISAGSPIEISAALTTNEMSALADVLAAFNDGKTKPPAPPSTVDLGIVETIGSAIELESISCDPSTRCANANLIAGSVTATVESGATTRVTYRNQSKPVLRVCKVAGPGVSAGTIFHFTAGGLDVEEGYSFDVPAGECRETIAVEGSYTLGEGNTDPTVVVSAIDCAPTTQCTNASTSAGAVHVAVVRGLTTVTFTNRSIAGTLRVCKVAGPGIDAGTEFGFGAGGIDIVGVPGAPGGASLTVPAGDCREAVVHEGVYSVAEPSPGTNVVISAIACDPPARCEGANLSVGAVRATVVGASTTTVTFTNRKRLGTLEVCKVAGPGVSAGAVFRIGATALGLLSGTTFFDVPAGECREGTLAEGSYILQETIPADHAVSAIGCEPANRCNPPVVTAGVIGVSVADQATTTVTYTNRSTLGTLRVCKVAGSGVAAGTVFRIGATGVGLNSGSVSFDVPAGECREASVTEGPYIFQEVQQPGFAVTSITCTPSVCGTPILSDGVITGSLAAQTTLTVTYVNAAAAGMVQSTTTRGQVTMPSATGAGPGPSR
jgi:hypothetical protein